MGEIAATVVKWTIRLGIIIFLAISFVLIFNMIVTGVSVGYNNTVLAEVMGMIQIWLPFNLGQIFNFIMTAASLVLMYYIYQVVVNIINKLVSD